MLLSAIINKIKTDTGVECYPSRANRLPDHKTQIPTPYIIVELDSVFRERHYGVGGNYETALKDYDFEIFCYHRSQGGALSVGNQVVTALENFSGPIAGLDSPQTIYNVHDIEITSEMTGFDHNAKLDYHSVFITATI